jgi:hypothetical protein
MALKKLEKFTRIHREGRVSSRFQEISSATLTQRAWGRSRITQTTLPQVAVDTVCSRETIYGAVERASSSMKVVGTVIAQKHPAETLLMTVTFDLQSVAGGDGINVADTASRDNMMVISYSDDDEFIDDLDWRTEWIIGGEAPGGDGDDLPASLDSAVWLYY